MFSYLQPNSNILVLKIYLSYADNEAERDGTDTPGGIRLPNLEHFTLYECQLSQEKCLEIFEMAPALRVFDLCWQDIEINESLLLQIVNIRKKQALLKEAPIVRLKLI